MITGYRAALAVETLKARRSRVPFMTFLAATGASGVAALFMFILSDPDRAHRWGLLNQKATLSGLTADWTGLLTFLAQIVAVADIMLFSFILTWVFGREAVDGTMRYLLALPVPRTTIVLAKLTVAAVWAAATNIWLILLVLATGKALALPGEDAAVITHGLGVAATAAGLMLLATAPIALIASAGRGYLAPLASALGALVVAQVGSGLGWAGIIPWAVPAVAADLVPDTSLRPPSLLIIAVTAVGGVLATLGWWRSRAAGR
jgi:ABC-2 type transport system permease protein